uniref:Oxysterol-binding protein n=1 Tax=Panagrellus redivivus TaxID=6233 RepID=A0A7E4ZTL3_PANRE
MSTIDQENPKMTVKESKIPSTEPLTPRDMTLEGRLRTARKSLAHHASRLKRRKKLVRKSTMSSMDPATMLLKAALDQPAIEHAIQAISTPDESEYEANGLFSDEKDEGLQMLQEKLTELQTCEQMIAQNGTELIELLARDGNLINRNTLDRIVLFKMTAKAMVDASVAFSLAAAQVLEKSPATPTPPTLTLTAKAPVGPTRSVPLLQTSKPKLSNRADSMVSTTSEEFFDANEPDSRGERDDDDGTLSNSDTRTPSPRLSSRRSKVPVRPSNSINYLALLKKCLGKDLSRISMPVDFNEPLSLLQRQTEDLEYSSLLDRAAVETDPERRLAFVAIFAISTYSNTARRSAKPFNPLLGETFDADRRFDFGWRAVSEQVSHHPPTSALSAESERGWTLDQSYTVTSKVKGRSLCVIPIGGTVLRFGDSRDVFCFEKAHTYTRMTNIMTGNIETDNSGEICVRNLQTGAKAVLKFHEPGYFSKEVRKVSGDVSNAGGLIKFRIEGVWDASATLFQVDSADNIEAEEVIWRVNPPVKDAHLMHNFTKLAIELNEPEPGLPPSDSRMRPDQRQMEEGHWSQANLTKTQLEEAQRARRKALEAQGIEWQPLWFRRKDPSEMLDKYDVYEFNSTGYWEARNSEKFDEFVNIFDANNV